MYRVAFTGHRSPVGDFPAEAAREKLLELAESGADTFYCGMARGCDLFCGEALCEIKKTAPVRLIACVPCRGQERFYTAAEKRQYQNVLSAADETVVLHDEYTSGCMFERNRYMIDRCDVVLAYLRSDHGGTHYTVRYAEKKGKRIIFV